MNTVTSIQYDEISADEFSDDKISGFANKTKFPPPQKKQPQEREEPRQDQADWQFRVCFCRILKKDALITELTQIE